MYIVSTNHTVTKFNVSYSKAVTSLFEILTETNILVQFMGKILFECYWNPCTPSKSTGHAKPKCFPAWWEGGAFIILTPYLVFILCINK